MKLVQNNPYRIIGSLVGVSTKNQERQIRRLKQFIEAEQAPEDDFSFPALGQLSRTLENVNEAVAKLNLDNDKMSAALFWFYEGNPISDEPAFDAIKEGNFKQAIDIWHKIVQGENVTRRNASAHHNLSSFYLSGALSDLYDLKSLLENAISLKLIFLESDFSKEIISLATDEIFKISKKEIQLLFLNEILLEIEQSKDFSTSFLLEVINKQEFTAKEDFLKSFVQKPIEQLERLLKECKELRKSKKKDVIIAGTNLYNAAKPILNQLKGILGTSNLKYTSISDKISEEILQSGIQLFNDYKDHKTYDPGEQTKELFAKAKSLAIGNIAKQRCQENTENLQEWIDDKPERDKQKLIEDDLHYISTKLERFNNLTDTIANAKELVDSCKPKMINIKNALGKNDDFYVKISSAIVSNAQGMLVQAVNEEVEKLSNNSFSRLSQSNSRVEGLIKMALDTTFQLGTFDMNLALKSHYKKNLEGIKSLARQLNISTLTPKEKLQIELKQAEDKLKEIQNTAFFKSELTIANNEMTKIMGWQFMRSESDKAKQIKEQKQKINNIVKRAETEKATQTNRHQIIITEIKSKIKKAEY